MRVAEAAEALHRKRVVRAFRLLQADHVRPHGLDEARDQIDAQADGVDVPGGDREGHRSGDIPQSRVVQAAWRAIPDLRSCPRKRASSSFFVWLWVPAF